MNKARGLVTMLSEPRPIVMAARSTGGEIQEISGLLLVVVVMIIVVLLLTSGSAGG